MGLREKLKRNGDIIKVSIFIIIIAHENSEDVIELSKKSSDTV